LPSARTGKHSEAATDPRGCIQSKPDPAQTAGRGHAAGVEEPLRQACFDPLLTLYVSDKSEAALQKPNLCVRCQVLHAIVYPTTSPDLQEIRYLHPGLLGPLYRQLPTTSRVSVGPPTVSCAGAPDCKLLGWDLSESRHCACDSCAYPWLCL